MSSVLTAPTKFTKFWGYESPLSKYRYCTINLHGIEFCSLIQCYEYSKAKHFGDSEAMEAILKTKKGSEHRTIGKNIKGFSEEVWKTVAEENMRVACWAKVLYVCIAF